MRLIKFLIAFFILILVAVGGTWYYVTFKVTHDLNDQYAGKQISVKGLDENDYFIAFKQVNPAGFPYKISWKVNGWSEESRDAKIKYHAPIYFGYDLLLQKLFIDYSGEITASYKPESHSFGARLVVDNYSVEVDLPLTKDLASTIKNMEDPFEIVNHMGDIHASSGHVSIFDLNGNEKFYDKEYEKLRISFVPQKEYKNVQDFLNNIPQELTAKYVVKTKPNGAKARRLPVSLFYGFSLLPSGFDVNTKFDIKTKGNNFKEIRKGLDIKIAAKCLSPFIDFNEMQFEYASGMDGEGRDYRVDMSSKMFFKSGMFDELFKRYDMLSPKLTSSPFGRMLNFEIKYIINNKEVFKFTELENNNYDYNFELVSSVSKNRRHFKVNDLSIFSDKSGFKLQHEMETLSKGKQSWKADGILLIKNYPAVVEFSSGYIYRFGKFRFLKDEARALYVDVNKAFLKDISDHPDSKSDDLSFEYSVNSRNLKNAKVGSVKFDQIARLYTLMLYQKLFDKVGHGGDVFGRMQKIIPDLDPNEPILQKVLPRISGNKEIKKSIEKELKKAIPGDAQDVIKKAIPKDLSKGLLKGILK